MSAPAPRPMLVKRRVAGFSQATGESDPQPLAAQPEPPAGPLDAGETPAPQAAKADSDTRTPTNVDADVTEGAMLDAKRPDRRAQPRKTTNTNATQAQRGGEVAKPGGHRHQTNFRLFDSEASYLKRLRRDFEDHGIDTDVTELVHALVYAARRGEVEPLELLRRWRRDFNEI